MLKSLHFYTKDPSPAVVVIEDITWVFQHIKSWTFQVDSLKLVEPWMFQVDSLKLVELDDFN